MENNNHPKVNYGKNGVLLVNLGTPTLRRGGILEIFVYSFRQKGYRSQSDTWQIILNLIILNLRPSKTAKAYKEIWMIDINDPIEILYKTANNKIKTKIR